ncbi:serine/threonine-protein kinase [Streptomyces sp. SP17BM10]|uniref:serine/threonine-protein kinase n=1 Tax=Streptomyces sp. SP17BM10 TaxID=3002530 RepID=UPI002E7790E8|nr:serine/threonine-protein kinase [Streptomyces sp. SP17BM10]MEE1783405.1 serine/threonine-protein kinase [Streptomyces sp. SP17BM10]
MPVDMSLDSLPASTLYQPLQPDDPAEVGGYRLHARLGAGGMGRVYLSYTPGGRPVALKTVRPEFAQDTEFRWRFAQEVTNARRIHGLYTAQVIDSGADDDVPWLATAYVPGPSLQQVVREHGALPARTVLLLMGGIAEALQAIHGAGVVHRDLKPANVLLAADGPRVIDFGIARAADAVALTGTGFRIGSPAFMAPEQALGRPVTPATDVFALGSLAAYTAGGTQPFGEGPETTVLYRVVNEQPDLGRVPGDLHALLLRCLAKQPEDRPTPAEIIEAARNHPAAGGGLRFADDWLPTQVSTDITRRSDLPQDLAAASSPDVVAAQAPPGSYGAVQPLSEVPTALLQPPLPTVAAPAPPAVGRPRPKGAARKTVLLLSALVVALGGTVGGVLLSDRLDRILAATGSVGDSPTAGDTGPDTPAPAADGPRPTDLASPATYTAAYTDAILTAPDDSYDFDIETGRLIPAQSAEWSVGHNANEFLIPTGSDAAITPGGRPAPADCSTAIDRHPATALDFSDLPAGRAFCVRSRSTHAIAIVRVISVTGNGPVKVSMDHYRSDS